MRARPIHLNVTPENAARKVNGSATAELGYGSRVRSERRKKMKTGQDRFRNAGWLDGLMGSPILPRWLF